MLKFTAIKELDVSDNLILDNGISLLSESLEGHESKIEILNISNCGFGKEAGRVLFKSMRSNANIKKVIGEKNTYSEEAMYNLASLLSQNTHL